MLLFSYERILLSFLHGADPKSQLPNCHPKPLTSNPHFTWTNGLWLTLRQLKLLIELCLPFALSLAARG